MAYLIGAAAVGIFALVFLLCGVALESKEKKFNANKRRGKAEVVGYERSPQAARHTLFVQIPALNDGNIYTCTMGKVDLSRYPKGTEVEVFYAAKKMLGIPFVEVRLFECPPPNGAKAGRVINIFSVAMIAVAAALAWMGISTIQ